MNKIRLLRIIVPAPSKLNIYGHISSRTTALGAIMVATAANKVPGWEVEVIDESNCHHRKWPPNAADGYIDHQLLQQERPADLVGFYAGLSCTMPRVYSLARLYKSMGAVTVAGSYHVRSETEEALRSGIDFVCMSKGEHCIRFLMEHIDETTELDVLKKQFDQMMVFGPYDMAIAYYCPTGQLSSVRCSPSFINQETGELDPEYCSLDFSLLRYGKIKTCPVMMRGGCPYHCQFCAVKDPPGKFIAEHFVRQIANLYERFGFKNFFIIDDHFGGDLDDPEDYKEIMKCLTLLTAYQKKIGKRFSFTCQIRLNACVDYNLALKESKNIFNIDWSKYVRAELLSAMRRAGIDNVCIGFESPIDEDLKRMHKGYLSKDMIDWTKIWHKFGFKIHGMFIFNYPVKREIIERENLKCDIPQLVKIYRCFIKKGKIDTVQILLPIPLPGTELRAWLEKEGRIFSQRDFDWEFYDGQFMLFDPLNCDSQDMQKAVMAIMGPFYHWSNIFRIIASWLFHFPRIVFPSVLALLEFRVDSIKDAFRRWKREYWRNNSIRFAGAFLVKGFKEKYQRFNIDEKLKKAKDRLDSESKEPKE